MSGYEDQSHRFVITGEDPEGHPRTILSRERRWRVVAWMSWGVH
jgi:hypothetical protein